MTVDLSRRKFLKRAGACAALACAPLPVLWRARTVQAADKLKTDVPPAALIADLQKFIPGLMAQMHVPGLAIAIIRDAKLLWAQGYGVTSAQSPQPVTMDTPFEAASLGIPAFAYAVLKLCEQGKLSLDAPLWNYYPGYFLPDDPDARLITTRMILAHTSGLRARPEDKSLKLASKPGAQWFYAILGIGYLQRVVERVAGQPLEAFMQANLLQPFGLRSSSYAWNEGYEQTAAKGHDQEGRRAPGKNFYERYRGFSAEQKTRLLNIQPEDAAPAAGYSLTTTATDYARFLSELIQPAQRDKQHLSEAMLAEMLKPQVRVSAAIAWGLGWGLAQTVDGAACWHWGNAGTLQHFAVAYRRQGLGLVILTNSSNGLKLCRELTPRAIGGEHPGFNLLLG